MPPTIVNSTPPTSRAAQYVRMSTEHQQYSPQNQSDTITKYAITHNMERFIPAIVIEAPEQDRQLMSLVENIARRPALTHAILFEVRTLRERGYSVEQIAFKLGLDRAYLYGICNLIDKGEEFLVSSVEAGRIPFSVAIEIAIGNNSKISRALSEAYEKGDLRGARISAARRVIYPETRKTATPGKDNPDQAQTDRRSSGPRIQTENS